jgi:hypothetical protein
MPVLFGSVGLNSAKPPYSSSAARYIMTGIDFMISGGRSANRLAFRFRLGPAARLCQEGGELTVNDSNRNACRELAAAGLMIPGHSFTRGREPFYVLTEVGRKFAAIKNAPWHAEQILSSGMPNFSMRGAQY